MSNESWQQAKLLNAYYRQVGLAAVGRGSCPRFATFAAGYDPELEGPAGSDGSQKVRDISMSLSAVKNIFYRGEVTSSFSDDTALCMCEIPKGSVSKPTKFNVIGVFDESGTLVAAAATLTDWLTPTELDRSYLSVTVPMEV